MGRAVALALSSILATVQHSGGSSREGTQQMRGSDSLACPGANDRYGSIDDELSPISPVHIVTHEGGCTRSALIGQIYIEATARPGTSWPDIARDPTCPRESWDPPGRVLSNGCRRTDPWHLR